MTIDLDEARIYSELDELIIVGGADLRTRYERIQRLTEHLSSDSSLRRSVARTGVMLGFVVVEAE